MNTFQAYQLIQTQTLRLTAPPEQVFPLFTPLGEKHWIASWDPEIIYPADGRPQVGAVFTTTHAGESKTVWTIVSYDPAEFYIAYVRTKPDLRVDRIEVRCEANLDGSTKATVTYMFTGLTEQGNKSIEELKPTHNQQVAGWEAAINHYLHHGKAMPHH